MMIRRLQSLCVTILLLFSVYPLFGEVFSVWPFDKAAPGAKSAAPDRISSLLDAKKFWNEPIDVNGERHTLTIQFSDLKLADAVKLLQEQYPGLKMVSGGRFLLVEFPSERTGWFKRLYLLELAGIHPLVIFSMEIGKNKREVTEQDWPHKFFPLVPGAENMTVYYFPVRNATFASYQLPHGRKSQALEEIGFAMLNKGWQATSAESYQIYSGSGQVFIKNDPLQMAILSISENKNGVGAAFYTRPLR